MSVKCTVCDAENWIVRLEQPRAWRTTNETFTLHQCASCGLIRTFSEITKDQIGKYYNTTVYDSHKASDTNSLFDRAYKLIQRVNFRHKYNTIQSILNKKVNKLLLLDYGCGNGAFLSYTKNKFLHVKGVEFEPRMIDFCKSSGLDVCSEVDFLASNETFDVITLFHVFEHLYNPNEYLKSFYNHLRENGILIIAVPNPDSFDAKYYKSDWAAWDVPIHLHHFKEEVLIHFANQYSFTLLKKRPMFFDAFYVSILSEKNKKTKLSNLRGVAVGLVSNLVALFSGQFSSKMYVFQKINQY